MSISGYTSGGILKARVCRSNSLATFFTLLVTRPTFERKSLLFITLSVVGNCIKILLKDLNEQITKANSFYTVKGCINIQIFGNNQNAFFCNLQCMCLKIKSVFTERHLTIFGVTITTYHKIYSFLLVLSHSQTYLNHHAARLRGGLTPFHS